MSTERRVLSRLGALGVVAGLSVVGPLLESALGDGRGWIAGMLLMLVAPSLVRAGGARFHPLDPETYVPAMYFLSAGYAPTLHLLLSKYVALSYAEMNATRVAYVGAVGCALVCAGCSRPPLAASAPPRLAPSPASPVGEGLPLRPLPRDWAAVIVGLIGMALIGVWVSMTGIRKIMEASYADTYLHEQGKGMLVAGWYIIQIAIVHCVARAAAFRRAGLKVPRLLTMAIVGLGVAFLFTLFLGRRGPILWVFTAVILCLHLSAIRVRRLWLFAAAAAIPIYAYAVEGYRTELGQDAAARIDAAQAGLERLDNPLVINELEGVFGTLVVIVEQRPPILHYPGESWVNALLMQVPKPIWRSRPSSLSERYAMWLSPSFAEEGGGYAFNMAGEGYLNLGAIGTLLQVALIAAVFFFLPLSVCVARPRDPLVLSLSTSVAAFAYNQFRGELASLLKIAIALMIGAMLVYVLSGLIEQLQERFASQAPRGFRAPPRARAG